jgi:hypothetical protein
VKPAFWLNLLLLGIATGVTIHLVRIKTKKPSDIPPILDGNLHKPVESDGLE